jgi:hypothetical protein
MSAKRSLLTGTFVFEQTAPALAARGHPRLTKAGNIVRTPIRDRNYEMQRLVLAQGIWDSQTDRI